MLKSIPYEVRTSRLLLLLAIIFGVDLAQAKGITLIPQVTLYYSGYFGIASSAESACQLSVDAANQSAGYRQYTSASYAIDPDLGEGCLANGILYSGRDPEVLTPYTEFLKWFTAIKGCPAGYDEFGGQGEPMCQLNVLASQKGAPASSCASEPGPGLFAADPINIATGNKFHAEVDYLTTDSQPLLFERFYNSGDGVWRHSYSSRILKADDNVIVQLEDGREARFSLSGGSPVAKGGETGKLKRSGGGWIYQSPKQVTYHFASNGELSARKSRAGSVTVSRQGSQVMVSDRNGRSLSITERADGALLNLVAGETHIDYAYDNQNRLVEKVSETAGAIRKKQYHYEDSNSPRSLTGITDENGNRAASWTYDANGRAVTSELAGGVSRYALDYFGDTTYVNGPLGERVIFTFELFDDVKKVVGIEGDRFGQCPNTNSTFSYDARGLLVSKVDSRGVISAFQYNDDGMEASRTIAVGRPEQSSVTTTWHASGSPSAIETPATRIEFNYDIDGKLTKRTIIDKTSEATPARITNFTYDVAARLRTIDGPRTDVSDVLTYGYDSTGNLTSVTNALGHLTSLSNHDAQGRPGSFVDASGVLTEIDYSPEGWVSEVVVDGALTRFDYDAVGQVTKVTRPDGFWSAYSWDAAGRLISISTPDGNRINYQFDAMGNRTSTVFQDAGNYVVYQHSAFFNDIGNLLRATGAGGQTDSFVYDQNNNITSVTDASQGTVLNGFDGLNRLIQSTDQLGGVTQYEYDTQGKVSQVKDPRGVTTNYKYDGLGNLVRLSSPDSGVTDFKHDAAGNVIVKRDARGVVSNFTYDALDRITSVTYPANPSLNVHYGYDMRGDTNHGVGRLTSIQDANGLVGYHYDAHGNLAEQIRSVQVFGHPQNEQVRYGYGDGSGQLSSITYPPGFRVTYERGLTGRVKSISLSIGALPPTVLASDISYLPFGPLQSLVWGNGIPLNRQFDQDFRMLRQVVGSRSSEYGYDPRGNIGYLSHGIFGVYGYQYDALGRLIEEKQDSRRTTYTYDATGNRQKRISYSSEYAIEVEVESQMLETAANSNRLERVSGDVVHNDAAGNLLQPNTGKLFTYDDRGRLKQVFSEDRLFVDYSYNALGQRTVKRVYSGVDVGTTTYLYDSGGKLLGQTLYSAAGNRTSAQYWIWLDDMPIAGVDLRYGSDGSAISSMREFYLHSDHLNTPRLATDANQVSQWSWSSDAFGVGVANTDVDGDGIELNIPLRFPGQQYDIHSGLHYNYLRDYDPNTGRYVESDPIGLKGGLNTYGYVLGNPLRFSDPLGLAVYIQCRAAQIAGGLIDHCWIKTDAKEAGMGADPDIPPGAQWEGYGMPVQITDHSNDIATTSTLMNNIDEACVNEALEIGKPLGRFMPPINQCQSFAYGTINKCRTGPQIPDVKIEPLF